LKSILLTGACECHPRHAHSFQLCLFDVFLQRGHWVCGLVIQVGVKIFCHTREPSGGFQSAKLPEARRVTVFARDG
jgi:hypothetical protein